jgi:soluble lytic murein transglycosylase
MASAQLRPMAQQLAATRTPAAYAGVQNYAASHPGEAASAAYLALGHAYVLDHRFPEATAMYKTAATSGEALDDYADFLGAQAALQAQHGADAYPLLTRFAERHPGSIFVANAPVLLANCYLQQGDPRGALRVLEPLTATPQASHADFRYTLGRAYQIAGDAPHAAPIFRSIYITLPLSFEASQSRQQLQTIAAPLTAAERKVHADQLFNAKRYAEAADEYHNIARGDSSLGSGDRDALAIYAAVCDLKLKHISRHEVEKLPATGDDSAALKMYMLAELSRNEDNRAAHDALIDEMIQRYPSSRWLEEALYSGGNMYLLKHDAQQAMFHYANLVKLFPDSTYAPSAHWRSAWMNYRLRRYSEAARQMDEQIRQYPAGIEIPSALYWRGRIYEDEEKNLSQAANYYQALADTYVNFYYAVLARQRLKVLSGQPAIAPSPVLSSVRKPSYPELTGTLPENEPHLIKARLLANAALNEYIGPEIQASETAGEWGALGQAEIFSSYGEVTRALQSMKHSGISFFALPMDQVPDVYWYLLFPQPFWADLTAQAQKNQLDPYLVASLIRQESEFNAGAVSHANAYGLMQLLPSVGKSIAKKQGLKGFNAGQLLNPAINLQLGTANLRQVLDRFGGQPEYALAAYNAGDVPVRQWMAIGEYKDIPEFVESIPYTETREYVQAILRNREMYRALYASH